MNSVSWFIYFAQVAESLGSMFCVLGVLGLIILLGGSMIITISQSVDEESFEPSIPPLRFLLATITLIFLGNLMPERNTMYAIAASQVGEQIVKSEAAQGVVNDATKALQNWIKKQIDPDVKK